MRQIFLCDFSTHYMMGDSCAVVRFTPKEFENFLTMMKASEDDTNGADSDKFDSLIDSIEKKNKVSLYGVAQTPYSELIGKMSTKRVISILKQGKNVSGEWEEGSFAFATTEKKAREAVMKIEAKHVCDGWF